MLYRRTCSKTALSSRKPTRSRVRPVRFVREIPQAKEHIGNKLNDITIIYTPWSNLHKNGSMAVGQVGFKDQKKVKRTYVKTKENKIVNRLNRKRVERFPDLRQEKADREKELRKKDRAAQQARVSCRQMRAECILVIR